MRWLMRAFVLRLALVGLFVFLGLAFLLSEFVAEGVCKVCNWVERWALRWQIGTADVADVTRRWRIWLECQLVLGRANRKVAAGRRR